MWNYKFQKKKKRKIEQTYVLYIKRKEISFIRRNKNDFQCRKKKITRSLSKKEKKENSKEFYVGLQGLHMTGTTLNWHTHRLRRKKKQALEKLCVITKAIMVCPYVLPLGFIWRLRDQTLLPDVSCQVYKVRSDLE